MISKIQNLQYNIESRAVQALDEFKDVNLINNAIINNYEIFNNPLNLTQIKVPDKYKYRPDRIAYEYYGEDSLFPIVLASNKLKTIFDFIPSKLDNKIFLLHTALIKQILKI